MMMEYERKVFRPHKGECVELPDDATGVSLTTWGDPEQDGHVSVRYLVPVKNRAEDLPSVTEGPGSHDSDLIGHPKPQVEAVTILQDYGPMEYEELKERLGLEQSEMQSLMRHLCHYNGLVKRESDGLVATPNERIDYYLPDEDGGE